MACQSETDLLSSLLAFEFDQPGAKRTFLARLATEQRWTTGFAMLAIREYKRFIYLAASGNRPVCPSDAVDAVWHLHLIYSRDYWDVWCADVLRARLQQQAGLSEPPAAVVFAASHRKHVGKALLVRLAQIAVERNCGRFEWSVLDWNKPSIDFYEAMGAKILPDWKIVRTTGDALAALAAKPA